jgi:hypothetical protein
MHTTQNCNHFLTHSARANPSSSNDARAIAAHSLASASSYYSNDGYRHCKDKRNSDNQSHVWVFKEDHVNSAAQRTLKPAPFGHLGDYLIDRENRFGLRAPCSWSDLHNLNGVNAIFELFSYPLVKFRENAGSYRLGVR